MKHKKPGKGQLSLNFFKVKQKPLTSTALLVLEGLRAGEQQSAIARSAGTSRARVSQIKKELFARGLFFPKKLNTTSGGAPPPFDVRYRSLKWNLSAEIKLPFDEERLNSGVRFTTWRVKGCLVRLNLGPRTRSLEIEAGLMEGKTVLECERKHDQEALNCYRWLCDHFPDLKAASAELAYTLNRPGEIKIEALKPTAERVISSRGPLRSEAWKIDDSLNNGGEAQLLLGGIATKSDIEALREELKALTEALNDFVRSIRGPQGPVPPEFKDGGMFR